MKGLWYLGMLIAFSHNVMGQVKKKIREYDKGFQVSLFPGIGTNGIHSASFINTISLNFFGGLSAGNRLLEIGIVANGNTKTSTGIQLAGLANIVGANAFMNLSQYEERELINKENFRSDMTGIQVAGFLNYVRSNHKGWQFSGSLNVVGGDLRGIQIAGIGNSTANGTNGSSAGLQLAGVYNVVRKSMGGFQIATAFNYTNGQLAGLQLAIINKARIIKGRNTAPPTRARGMQIGLINQSKEMDGVQIGLINFGGKALGKQFGLINFFSTYPTKENVRKNTPVGLLNFGSKGSVIRATFNEILTVCFEYTTGSCLNCSMAPSEMPFNEGFQIFNQNALIYGFDPFRDIWGMGYGFMKILYNKNSMLPTDPRNRNKLISYGLRVIHLSRKGSFDREMNLVSKLHVDFGKRVRSRYVLVGASLNWYLSEENGPLYSAHSLEVETGSFGSLVSRLWPGYSVGVQL
jgi:hypothetical protein